MTQIEWKISQAPVAYEDALAVMEQRVADIRAGTAPEMVWLLEHPPLYTAGTSAKVEDLRAPQFPVYETGRGGQYTYHGPGQRVAYVMLDLKTRQQTPDIKQYVCNLEQWIIDSLQEFDIKGERRAGRVGIWVNVENYPLTQNSSNFFPPPLQGGRVREGGNFQDKKIAAIGVRIRHWVTYHGISINLTADLTHFNGIVPCGISDAGVTSFEDLGVKASMEELDAVLRKNFRF